MKKVRNFILTGYLNPIDFPSLCLSVNLWVADPHVDIYPFKDALFLIGLIKFKFNSPNMEGCCFSSSFFLVCFFSFGFN